MFSHTSSFLGAYSICMHHPSMFCVCPPPPPFFFMRFSCVFLFALFMCTPYYLFGGQLVSCYFLSSSRTIGFSLTSLPAASKLAQLIFFVRGEQRKTYSYFFCLREKRVFTTPPTRNTPSTNITTNITKHRISASGNLVPVT
jgi:hypothetical protein